RRRLTITLGRGVANPRGRAVTLDEADPVGSFADAIAADTGREAWWSGSTFRGDHRAGENWIAAAVLGLDLDGPGHVALDDATAARLDELAAARTLPGSVYHRTPAGARLAAVLQEPIEDPATFAAAIAGFAALARAAIAGLQLEVDHTLDTARLFYGPK